MWYNPLIIACLKSPLHGLLSRNMMVITITGRKSGKRISVPTNYICDQNTLWVISWRTRAWWRNLRQGAPVEVLLAGQNLAGHGQVAEDPQDVADHLMTYCRLSPATARYMQIGLDSAGQPIPADCDRAAQAMVVVTITLA